MMKSGVVCNYENVRLCAFYQGKALKGVDERKGDFSERKLLLSFLRRCIKWNLDNLKIACILNIL